MARKAKRKVAAKVATKSKKTKKVIAVKSVRPKKPAAKKPARKTTRRSSADVAKLQRAVVKGLKSGKSADALAADLGVSRAYIYALKNKG